MAQCGVDLLKRSPDFCHFMMPLGVVVKPLVARWRHSAVIFPFHVSHQRPRWRSGLGTRA